MWDHYRKTLVRMQIFIAGASAALYYALGRRWIVALTFFAMMQVGAVVGAWWGDRLRRKLRPQFY
jgi:uncharacterized membrane protein YfcA